MGSAADTLPTAKTPDVSNGRKREPVGGGDVGDSKGLESADRAVARRLFGNDKSPERAEREPAERPREDDGQAEDRHDQGDDDAGSDRYIDPGEAAGDEESGGGRGETARSPERERDRRQRREIEAAARTLLSRDNYTEREIGLLLKNTATADLHDLTRRIRKRHAGQDDMGNRLKKLEARGTGQQSADDAGGDDAGSDPVEALEKHLAETGDPATAKLFRAALQSLRPAESPNGQRATMTKAQAVEQFQPQLAEVRHRFPQVKDAENAADLLETANRMVKSGAIAEGTDLVDALHAAAETIWPGGKHMSQREFASRHREESDGQIDTGQNGRQPRAPAPSEDDEDRKAVRDLKRGMSPEDIQHARGRR